jgi:hypothetical protein
MGVAPACLKNGFLRKNWESIIKSIMERKNLLQRKNNYQPGLQLQ